jgi:hypothetical protein
MSLCSARFRPRASVVISFVTCNQPQPQTSADGIGYFMFCSNLPLNNSTIDRFQIAAW